MKINLNDLHNLIKENRPVDEVKIPPSGDYSKQMWFDNLIWRRGENTFYTEYQYGWTTYTTTTTNV